MRYGLHLHQLVLLILTIANVTSPLRAQAGKGNSVDSLLIAREHAYWQALKAQDTTAAANAMNAGAVDVDISGIRRATTASLTRFIVSCKTNAFSLGDAHVVHGETTAVVTYRAKVDQTCWGEKAPPVINVMTVYERHGDQWVVIAHSETPTR